MVQHLVRASLWKHLLPYMFNLKQRSDQKELLDNDAIPFDDIKQNMKELNTINTWLGGHAITITGLKKVLSKHRLTQISICEIGCGGGDNMIALNNWCKQNKLNTNFTGIDIKPTCIDFAKQQAASLQANWICNDYQNVEFGNNKPDIVFASLFCHHFSDGALLHILKWMKENSTIGFFINDLHRHPLAYHSIKIITSALSKSYLVKNDAPLSVARGFKKIEWQQLLNNAGIADYDVTWQWAFRHLIVYKHE